VCPGAGQCHVSGDEFISSNIWRYGQALINYSNYLYLKSLFISIIGIIGILHNIIQNIRFSILQIYLIIELFEVNKITVTKNLNI